jgi:hypothetical protein
MLNPETHEPTSNLVLKSSNAQSRSSRLVKRRDG